MLCAMHWKDKHYYYLPNVARALTPSRYIGFIGFITMQHISLPTCRVHEDIYIYNQVNKDPYIYISLFPAQYARALKEIVVKGAVLNNANNVQPSNSVIIIV